jgi:ubiquinone/menaquinone biosynthesis C-methylase UbiE/pimeloyl-ACP methyl ester carboxylesterase
MTHFRTTLRFVLPVLLLLAAGVLAATAQDKSVKPGVNDGYQKKDIQATIKLFEGEKRDVAKYSEEILAACELKPGMVVADVGAGTGLFTRPLAAKVAPGGKVFAVDITEKFVEHVKKTCKEEGLNNVETILSTATSAKLPPASADLVFTCDTYHHFEYPFKMLASVRQALRPDGCLVIVDRKDASNHVRASQETVKKEVTTAGFVFLDEKAISEREYLMRFRKADAPSNDESAGPGRQATARLDIQVQVTLNYLLFLPKDYGKKDSWPLMLFLHGAGERGDNLELVKVHGPPKIVETDKDFPFILVSPQSPPKRWWQPSELTALLDDVVAKYKVDEDRVYVTGLSMGGFGTWALAAYTPDRFAAIVPICGGGVPYRTRQFPHLPVWAFHGGKDSVVPAERSQEMVEALKKLDGNAKLTVYPEAGHNSWTETYGNPELYRWLLEQKRVPQ